MSPPYVPSQSDKPESSVDGASLAFSDASELLLFATQHWRTHLVLTDPLPLSELDEFSKRPSFLLVRVDAGLMVRFQR